MDTSAPRVGWPRVLSWLIIGKPGALMVISHSARLIGEGGLRAEEARSDPVSKGEN